MLPTVRFEIEQKKVSTIEKMSMFCLSCGWEFVLFAQAYHIYVADAGSGCFIATASTGSENSLDVVLLTKYRDDVLRKSFWGRMFIKTYEFISPPIARWLRKGIRRRLWVRKYIITPIVRFVSRIR